MRATVRRFHSPDVDLETHEPADPADVGVLIQIMAGPAEMSGEESFDIVVCTPRWLERWTRENGPLVGRHHLIVGEFDAARVKLFLRDAVESQEAATWHALAERIGRIGKWEFEDYQSDRTQRLPSSTE